MIEVQQLSKYYGPTRSIEDVSFRVEAGEVLGFLGPNGAGKSTTMRILAGLARPSAGTARIGGWDVGNDHLQVRRILGYLPESSPLYGDMTLDGYLRFMAGIRGFGIRAARREMERVSELVNLAKERPRLLRNLSKGTRQRAAIAQALLGDPDVLIFDEPTVGLDPSQINDVRQLIRSMQGRRTVILSTHILTEVELTCSRIVIIADGRIAAQGTPDELLARRAGGFLLRMEGDQRTAERILKDKLPAATIDVTRINGLVEARITPPPSQAEKGGLAAALVKDDIKLLEMRPLEARLEDVFLEVTGRGVSR